MSFKDDILEIDVNHHDFWGRGPVRYKWAALRLPGELQAAAPHGGLWPLVWLQSQINKSQFNTCPI